MAAMRIPATVITGFLGAGKTTLIRRLIEQADGRRLALIVNEFGDVGVDGEVLASCGVENCSADDIIELANGCICCTVADDFLPSMQKLLEQVPAPDHIIIETSGLALPQPLVQAFAWPDIRQRVMLDGVVTVVDGAALADGMVAADLNALEAQRQADPELDHETPVDELFRDQVAAANILIVSKGDLIDGAAGERVTRRLNALTDGTTPVMITRGDTAPLKAIFGLGLEDEAFARSEHFDHHHHHHDDDHDDDHGHDAFHSVVLRLPMLDDHEAFIRNLTATVAEHGLLRAKGFLAIRGKALPLTVQAVGARVDSYFGGTLKDDEGRLVLIGLKQTDMAAIASSLGGEMIAGGMIAGAA
ncbi:MAG: Putative metal chaperone YciC [SAR116 cluster bacterium MED-G04]|nr:MAG: Putative metal chaperone YciC [SAR116 cluster bacterium MED-G04]